MFADGNIPVKMVGSVWNAPQRPPDLDADGLTQLQRRLDADAVDRNPDSYIVLREGGGVYSIWRAWEGD